MRTFLACSGIDGQDAALGRLEELARQRRPDAILFAGGLFAPLPSGETISAAAERRHHDMLLLEKLFATLGATQAVAGVIPGANDAPLRAFFMAGMHARSHWPGIHLVHCTIVTSRDVVLSGIGGELTQTEDSGEPIVRCSRTTAEYFLQAFGAADESERILLLGSAPQGDLGGEQGNPLAGELANSYHPRLCVVGGPHEHQGCLRIARTVMVNPGRLSSGSAAWIDWNREVNEQVELL